MFVLRQFSSHTGLTLPPGKDPWADSRAGMLPLQQWCEAHFNTPMAILHHNPIGAWLDDCLTHPFAMTSMRNPVDHTLSFLNYKLETTQQEDALTSPASFITALLHGETPYYNRTRYIARWQVGLTMDLELTPVWRVPRWREWLQSLVLCELTDGNLKDAKLWNTANLPPVGNFLASVATAKNAWDESLLRLLSNMTAATDALAAEHGIPRPSLHLRALNKALVAVFHRLYDLIVITEKFGESIMLFRHTLKPANSRALFHPCTLIPMEVNVSDSYRVLPLGLDDASSLPPRCFALKWRALLRGVWATMTGPSTIACLPKRRDTYAAAMSTIIAPQHFLEGRTKAMPTTMFINPPFAKCYATRRRLVLLICWQPRNWITSSG